MIRRVIPADQDSGLARLAATVERLTADVDRLSALPALVTTQARGLADLADVVDRLRRTTTPTTSPAGPAGPAGAATGPVGGHATADTAGNPDSPNGPGNPEGPGGSGDAGGPAESDDPDEPVAPAWLTVEDPAVAVAWLGELSVWVPRVWQPYLQTKTPDCWPWHPDVVAELLVIKYLWDDAVAAGPDPAPLAAWHDRWRPSAAHRVARRMAGCERAFTRHKILNVEYTYDLAWLDELAAWWSRTHGTDPAQPAPGLTVDRSGR